MDTCDAAPAGSAPFGREPQLYHQLAPVDSACRSASDAKS